MSAVAEHAGVRRSTLYRHFPDEAALFDACTAHWAAANPLPDLGAWAAIEDPAERLRAALGELYAYYRRTERMIDEPPARRAACPSGAQQLRRLPRLPRRRRETLMLGRRRGARAARATAPRSATRSPSRPGARWRASRASTTRRPSSSCAGWWRASRWLRQRPPG